MLINKVLMPGKARYLIHESGCPQGGVGNGRTKLISTKLIENGK